MNNVHDEPQTRRFVCCLALVFLLAAVPAAAGTDDPSPADKKILELLGRECPVIRIWPGGTGPDEKKDIGAEGFGSAKRNVIRVKNVTVPTITVVRPEKKRTGRAVIVCPGGGYSILALDLEGTEIVQWLNDAGITGILLKYRVPRRGGDFPRHHHALQDAQRAMSIVRSRAAEWGIDPEKIGICGFSAGGHLSAMMCHAHGTRIYEPVDDLDKASCRPDFAVLVYPAYLTDPIDSPDIAAPFAKPEKGVVPPVFIAVGRKDRFAKGALRYCRELVAAGAAVECHVYFRGGHGVGLRKERGYPLSEWAPACARWMKDLAAE